VPERGFASGKSDRVSLRLTLKETQICWRNVKGRLGLLNLKMSHMYIRSPYCRCMESGQLSQYSDWLRAGRPRAWSSSPGKVKNFLFSTLFREVLGPPNLLSNGYRGLFQRGLSGRGVKLTTHLQLVLRSRKCWSIHPLRDNITLFILYCRCIAVQLILI
jgi:hypothetical protein